MMAYKETPCSWSPFQDLGTTYTTKYLRTPIASINTLSYVVCLILTDLPIHDSFRIQSNKPTYMFQVSVTCYILLYFLVSGYSEGEMSKVIEYMILAIIPFIILNGLLLFLGALEVCVFKPALTLANLK